MPASTPQKDQALLVLDLDETLLFAQEYPLEREPDCQVGPYCVYWRPHLPEFVAYVAARFRLGVWTSSSPAYAQMVCAAVFPKTVALEFVWASDRCTLRRDLESDSWVHSKDFRKLRRRGYDLRRVLMVDDSPEKHLRNYGNLVRVAPFFGALDDDELRHLANYLASLASEPDLRAIEKRHWRRRHTESPQII